MGRRLCLLFSSFSLANMLVFAAYRLIFLSWFAVDISASEIFQALLRGLRLDIVLLSSEMFLITAVFFLLRYMVHRRLFIILLSATVLNLLITVLNLLVYRERAQQVGDLLMGYITSPIQIYMATIPFVMDHYIIAACIVLGLSVFVYAGIILRRRVYSEAWDMWRPGRRIIASVLLLGFLFVPVLEPVKVKKTRSAKGWKLKFCQSKYYAVMNSQALNQAVINPLQELLWVYLPAELYQTSKYQLQEKDALGITRDILGIHGVAGSYPLLTQIKGRDGLNIESVIILQVEGLSGFLVNHKENGQYVMPFLHHLSQENLYFPNTIQSFNATAGGVFSTVTGFHKEAFNEQTQRFAAHEMNGFYGTLPHVLGSNGMHHFFFLGFVHSSADFITFMQNQGYFTYDLNSMRERSDGRWPAGEMENALGLYDAYYLRTSADIIIKNPGPFTAHLMTSTTHSPWSVPDSFPRRFSSPALNAFAYADTAIKSFFERLREGRPDFDRILIVIVADHSSITEDDDPIGRRRIALLFCNPRFKKKPIDSRPLLEAHASQVDVLPTVLSLMGGQRAYAGFGRDLLDPSAVGRGVVSSGRHEAIYIKDGAAFEYRPLEKTMRLYSIGHDRKTLTDISADQPNYREQMKKEFLAITETARRIGGTKKVFPIQAKSR